MTTNYGHDILYPSKQEILAIHRDIIQEDDEADTGTINTGHIDFALNCIEHGHFGEKPETIHEKAVALMRYLSANHPFTDGNKRTALNATWTFYALNGLYFDYGEDIKAILKLFAVMERMVDLDEVVEYFGSISYPEDHDRVPSGYLRILHLTKWEQNHDERFDDLIRNMVREDIDEELFTELLELTKEYFEIVDSYSELRDEHTGELPEEFHEHVDFLVEEKNEMESFLEDIYEAYEQEGEVNEKVKSELKQDYDLEGDPEEKLREYVDDL